MYNWKRLQYATCGLVLAQMIHAGTPADTSSEGYVGLIVGLILLVAAVVAAIGSFGLTPWTPRLTFVTGVLPSDVSTEDDVAARASLVRVLAHAARADAREGLRVTSLGSGSSPKEIAQAALGHGSMSGAIAAASEEDYSEWRMELLGMMWVET